MRRTSIGLALVLAILGAAALTQPVESQGQRRGRLDVETVAGREVVAREVLVKFRDRPQPSDFARISSEIDGDVARSIGRTGVVRLRSRSLDAGALVARLASRGDVEYAEPNYLVHALAPPNDVSFPQLWGLHNVGQSVYIGFPGTPGADIHALDAWEISVGSTTNVVAVVDTGVDYTHPDLAPNMWSAPTAFTVTLGGQPIHCAAGTHGFNAIQRTCDPMDDHDHGTHTAGTIGAAGNNGLGVVGVNWTTRIMGIKFIDADGTGTSADAIDAIAFANLVKQIFSATDGANVRVLSNSWGGLDFSQALRDEISAANDAEMLFVAAAGNDLSDNDAIPFYPAGYDVPNVIAVAATGNHDDIAWFSNYGAASVDLGAPGMDILSTTIGNSYEFFSGTSMATPHVSGAAALVLSRCALDTAALKDTLLGTVDPAPDLVHITVTGGRLNVHSALSSCIAPPEPPTQLIARGDDGQVVLSWSAGLGAIHYTVKRSLTSGGPYVVLTPDVTGIGYTDTDVVNGTRYYYVVSGRNSLGESSDSNEASAMPNPPSDLVVSSFTVPSGAGAGMTISVSVTTRNQGVGPADSSTTRVYLSNDSLLDSGDWLLAPDHHVPLLTPGDSMPTSLSLTVPPDVTTGFRYLIALADADDVLIESHEGNNSAWRRIQIGPDLAVSSLTAPGSAAPGQTISVNDTVTNQGGALSPATITAFYLSKNGTLDASDVPLPGSRPVPTLAAGASSSGATSVQIPSDTATGSYYLLAQADNGNTVPEIYETNNIRLRSVLVGSDLVISALTVPSTGSTGSIISVSDTTTNQGTGIAGTSTVRFYLSVNATLDAGDTLLDAGRAVPDLAAGTSSSGPTTLMLPSSVATGSYYLIAKVDGDDVVVETSEANNTSARAIQIGADLIVSAFTAPTIVAPGVPFDVSDTVKNQGAGAAAASMTRFYLSANASLDAGDLLLVGGRSVPSLGAGQSHTGSTPLALPPGVTVGSYYLIAKADGDNVVTEAQETNNTMARSIQTGGDLVVSALTVPAKGGAGGPLTITDTIANQGSIAVSSSMTRFYLSANAILDGGDLLLEGSRVVAGLSAGQTSTGSTTVSLPSGIASGVQYIFATADADNAVSETQEANNTAVRSIQIGPDLVVSSLTVPLNAAAGSAVAISDTTLNQGQGAASPSSTAFYLSVDTTLSADDVILSGVRVVGSLPAGGSSTGPVTVTIPTSTPAGPYNVIAKADDGNAVTEAVETNNTFARPIRIGPDLTVVASSVSPSSVIAGGTVTVTETVTNQGAAPAASSVNRFYLSTDPSLDGSDTLLAGSRAVPALVGGASSMGPTVLTIPPGTPPRIYFVVVKADADGSIAEGLESNNTAVRSVQVTPGP